MKNLLRFFVLVARCANGALFAQKNTLALDLRYLPVNDYTSNLLGYYPVSTSSADNSGILRPTKGLSLSYYFKTTSTRALGARINLNSDRAESGDHVRTALVAVDLVNRWDLTAARRLRVSVEMGIAGAWRLLRLTPNLRVRLVPVCGVNVISFAGPQTPWTTHTTFLYGVATAVNAEFRVFKRVSLGIPLAANAYYNPEDCGSLSWIFHPSLRTSFSF
jgi:hypothetical protein